MQGTSLNSRGYGTQLGQKKCPGSRHVRFCPQEQTSLSRDVRLVPISDWVVRIL